MTKQDVKQQLEIRDRKIDMLREVLKEIGTKDNCGFPISENYDYVNGAGSWAKLFED